jgi:hypothetical protein
MSPTQLSSLFYKDREMLRRAGSREDEAAEEVREKFRGQEERGGGRSRGLFAKFQPRQTSRRHQHMLSGAQVIIRIPGILVPDFSTRKVYHVALQAIPNRC